MYSGNVSTQYRWIPVFGVMVAIAVVSVKPPREADPMIPPPVPFYYLHHKDLPAHHTPLPQRHLTTVVASTSSTTVDDVGAAMIDPQMLRRLKGWAVG